MRRILRLRIVDSDGTYSESTLEEGEALEVEFGFVIPSSLEVSLDDGVIIIKPSV